MSSLEQSVKVIPGFAVTVFPAKHAGSSLKSVSECEVTILRPDMSVIVRKAKPVEDFRVELDLHSDDLSLPGEYTGEVRCELDGTEVKYSPAFKLLIAGGEKA